MSSSASLAPHSPESDMEDASSVASSRITDGTNESADSFSSDPSPNFAILPSQRSRPRELTENEKTLAEAMDHRSKVPHAMWPSYDAAIASCQASRAAVAADPRAHFDDYHQVLLRLRRLKYLPSCTACECLKDHEVIEMCDGCYAAMRQLHSRQ
jgi:hypothetical protein